MNTILSTAAKVKRIIIIKKRIRIKIKVNRKNNFYKEVMLLVRTHCYMII